MFCIQGTHFPFLISTPKSRTWNTGRGWWVHGRGPGLWVEDPPQSGFSGRVVSPVSGIRYVETLLPTTSWIGLHRLDLLRLRGVGGPPNVVSTQTLRWGNDPQEGTRRRLPDSRNSLLRRIFSESVLMNTVVTKGSLIWILFPLIKN